MTAVGYIRVSTEEQAISGLGLDDQRACVNAYCDLRGFQLREVIEDNGVSGGKLLWGRPGGARLREALRRRTVTDVVMFKLDRGFRNAADCLTTVESWQRRRITLHVVDLGGAAIDTASAAGKFMLTILAGAAEMERNLTRERTRAALEVKRQRGQRITRFAPFGFRLDDEGQLCVDRSEQRTLQMIQTLHDSGLSLRRIAVALQSRGRTGRNGQPISAKTVHAVLQRD